MDGHRSFLNEDRGPPGSSGLPAGWLCSWALAVRGEALRSQDTLDRCQGRGWGGQTWPLTSSRRTTRGPASRPGPPGWRMVGPRGVCEASPVTIVGGGGHCGSHGRAVSTQQPAGAVHPQTRGSRTCVRVCACVRTCTRSHLCGLGTRVRVHGSSATAKLWAVPSRAPLESHSPSHPAAVKHPRPPPAGGPFTHMRVTHSSGVSSQHSLSQESSMEHSGPSSFPWGWFSGRRGCHHRVFLLQERSLHLDQARILGALWAAGRTRRPLRSPSAPPPQPGS